MYCGCSHSQASGPGWYKKAVWANHAEQSCKQNPLVASTPASLFLPWFPSMMVCNVEVSAKWSISPLCCLWAWCFIGALERKLRYYSRNNLAINLSTFFLFGSSLKVKRTMCEPYFLRSYWKGLRFLILHDCPQTQRNILTVAKTLMNPGSCHTEDRLSLSYLHQLRKVAH